jgi:hypothetical protein
LAALRFLDLGTPVSFTLKLGPILKTLFYFVFFLSSILLPEFIYFKGVIMSLAQLIGTMHKICKGPGFEPRSPQKKNIF